MISGNCIDIYEDRIAKFKNIISEWQHKQCLQIDKKSEEQKQFATHKIFSLHKPQIQSLFDQSIKEHLINIKIHKSRMINESRLSKMKAKHQMLEKIKIQSSNFILLRLCNTRKYIELLSNLIVQGMIALLEPNLQLRCIERDREIVLVAIQNALETFTNLGSDLMPMIQIDEQHIPESELGGIILTANNGKIVCNNTLKARLSYSVQHLLPQINHQLFFKLPK